MQERGAKQKCGGGRVGVIYSSLRNPLEILAGAYCLIKKGNKLTKCNYSTLNAFALWMPHLGIRFITCGALPPKTLK